MKIAICAVRDSKADNFPNVILVPTVGLALRNFVDAINTEDPNSPMWKHPGDFELFHLGYFDDKDGTFENIQHQSIAHGDSARINNQVGAAVDAKLRR